MPDLTFCRKVSFSYRYSVPPPANRVMPADGTSPASPVAGEVTHGSLYSDWRNWQGTWRAFRILGHLVNSLKGVSSRLLRRDRPDIALRNYYKGVLWTPGYYAGSCGGAPISIIRQYIEQQQTPG